MDAAWKRLANPWTLIRQSGSAFPIYGLQEKTAVAWLRRRRLVDGFSFVQERSHLLWPISNKFLLRVRCIEFRRSRFARKPRMDSLKLWSDDSGFFGNKTFSKKLV